MITDFQPTLIQKLLGRNYKWWYLFFYYINQAGASISANLFSLVSLVINFVMVAYIWIKVGSGADLITYLLLGRIYKTMTDNFWYDRIGGDIINGKLSSLLLQPFNYINYHFVASLGARLTRNLVNLLAIVATVFFILKVFNTSIVLNSNFYSIIFFIPITLFINFHLAFIVGTTAFFIKDRRDFGGLTTSYASLVSVFVGTVIPLSELPAPITLVLEKLPFAFALHHPMQIYLGKYTAIETLYVFLGGILWCIILYFLAKLIFKLGLKRNEAVGL